MTPSDPVGDPVPVVVPKPPAEPDPPVGLAAAALPDDPPALPAASAMPPGLVPPEALPLSAVAVPPEPGVTVVVGDDWAMLLMNVAVHVTVLPPPLEEPLH